MQLLAFASAARVLLFLSSGSPADAHPHQVATPTEAGAILPRETWAPPPKVEFDNNFAISIVADKNKTIANEFTWRFISGTYGEPVGCRLGSAMTEYIPSSSKEPYYPGSTSKFWVDQMDCVYKNSGGNAGSLKCLGIDVKCDLDPATGKANKGRYDCGELERQPMYTCSPRLGH